MSANLNRSLSSVILAAAMILCTHGAAAEIHWSSDIEESLQRASSTGQPVLMEFTADWCVFCKKMEKNTFTNVDVTQRISRNFVAVRVNADQNKDLVKELGIKGLPAILIVSSDLRIIKRISGYQTPEALIPQLDEASAVGESQAGPSTITSSQPAEQMPVERARAPHANLFETDPETPSAPARGELSFEAITQDEAPRVGSRRPASPSSGQFFNASDSRPSQAETTTVTDTEGESFFRTISREQSTRKVADADTAVKESTGPAFGGLCVVSAVEDRELVKGAARDQVNYRGHLLYFSSTEKKELFLASPVTYWPMLDGACAMTLLDDEKNVEGSLEFAAVFRKRIWLFTSQEALQEFLRDPADISEEATEIAAELHR